MIVLRTQAVWLWKEEEITLLLLLIWQFHLNMYLSIWDIFWEVFFLNKKIRYRIVKAVYWRMVRFFFHWYQCITTCKKKSKNLKMFQIAYNNVWLSLRQKKCGMLIVWPGNIRTYGVFFDNNIVWKEKFCKTTIKSNEY